MELGRHSLQEMKSNPNLWRWVHKNAIQLLFASQVMSIVRLTRFAWCRPLNEVMFRAASRQKNNRQ